MESAKLVYFIALPIVVFAAFVWIRRHGPASGRSNIAPTLVSSEVLVRGWPQGQLVSIIEDFVALYEIDASMIRDEPAAGGWTRISFSEPIDANLLLYLVNYLHYPMETDLTSVAPVAVARFATTGDFGPAGATPGQQAKAYVPLNDTAHDEVFVTLADNAAYRVSFTDMAWAEQSDARMSAEVRALPFGVAAG